MYLLLFLLVLPLLQNSVHVNAEQRKKWGCILPPEPIFGHFKYKQAAKAIEYVCDDNYVLYGLRGNTRKCMKNRKWTGTDGDCVLPFYTRVRCQKPRAPKNGYMFFRELDDGEAEVEFLCEAGFKMIGSKLLKCRDGSSWTGGEFPICRSQRTVEDFANILKEDFIDPLAAATADSEDSIVQGKLSVGKRGLEIIFILDVSASIGAKSLNTSKKFIQIIVNEFGVSPETSGGTNGTRIALITFSDKAEIVFNLDDENMRSADAINKKIDQIQSAGGGTNLADAFYRASKIFESKIKGISNEHQKQRKEQSSKAIFVITDAEATYNKSEAKQKAFALQMFTDRLKTDPYGFEIFAIGVGTHIDHDTLNQIASHPKDEHVFLLDKFNDLGRVGDIIAEKNIDYGQCGMSGTIELQQNEHKSPKGAWPWLGWVSVMMLKNETSGSPSQSWTCGGVLLSDRWFLTVAHCVSFLVDVNGTTQPRPADHRTINVNLGDYNLYETDDTEIVVPVKRVLLHPSYTGQVNEYEVREYDVALLDFGIQTPLELNKHIRPACYPTAVKNENATDIWKASDVLLSSMLTQKLSAYLVGWGHAPRNVNDTWMPWDSMYQRRIPVQPESRCSKRFSNLNQTLFFCVFDEYESNYCRGDVGGPLVNEMANNRFTVLGLASRTYDCEKDGTSFSIVQNTVVPVISDWVGKHLNGCNRVEEDPTWPARMKERRKEREQQQREDEMRKQNKKPNKENKCKKNKKGRCVGLNCKKNRKGICKKWKRQKPKNNKKWGNANGNKSKKNVRAKDKKNDNVEDNNEDNVEGNEDNREANVEGNEDNSEANVNDNDDNNEDNVDDNDDNNEDNVDDNDDNNEDNVDDNDDNNEDNVDDNDN